MPNLPTTPKDVQAMEAARRDFHEAVAAFENAIQEQKPIEQIDEAIRKMNEKQAAYRAFAQRFFANYPRQ